MALTDQWFTPSESGGCVEVRVRNGLIQLRDTKLDELSPILQFTPHEWETFLDGARRGLFDLSEPAAVNS